MTEWPVVLATGGGFAESTAVIDTLRRKVRPVIAGELSDGQELHSAVVRDIGYTTAHIAQAVELQ